MQNNLVEGWNSKINPLISIFNIFFFIEKLKQSALESSLALKSLELEYSRTTYVELDKRFDTILDDFDRTNDLRRCQRHCRM